MRKWVLIGLLFAGTLLTVIASTNPAAAWCYRGYGYGYAAPVYGYAYRPWVRSYYAPRFYAGFYRPRVWGWGGWGYRGWGWRGGWGGRGWGWRRW